jgi:hypothetical protein
VTKIICHLGSIDYLQEKLGKSIRVRNIAEAADRGLLASTPNSPSLFPIPEQYCKRLSQRLRLITWR